MTKEEFKEKTGREPENDDLERSNCIQAGASGHHCCGWCNDCDKPRFECGCKRKRVKRGKKQQIEEEDLSPYFRACDRIGRELTPEEAKEDAEWSAKWEAKWKAHQDTLMGKYIAAQEAKAAAEAKLLKEAEDHYNGSQINPVLPPGGPKMSFDIEVLKSLAAESWTWLEVAKKYMRMLPWNPEEDESMVDGYKRLEFRALSQESRIHRVAKKLTPKLCLLKRNYERT